MTYHTLTLSWPAKILWPNGRGHHMARAKATKAARAEAFYEAHRAGVREAGTAHVHFTFHPQKKGPPPDESNAGAAFKAALDGIADVLKMNDRYITTSHSVSGERRGCVVVNVSTDETAAVPLKGTVS